MGSCPAKGSRQSKPAACSRWAKGKAVELFLRDVSTIDAQGRTLLRGLARKGVRLRASGVYSSYVVGEIQSESAAHAAVPQDPTGNRQSRMVLLLPPSESRPQHVGNR